MSTGRRIWVLGATSAIAACLCAPSRRPGREFRTSWPQRSAPAGQRDRPHCARRGGSVYKVRRSRSPTRLRRTSRWFNDIRGHSGRGVDRLWNLGTGGPGRRRCSLRARPHRDQFYKRRLLAAHHHCALGPRPAADLIVIGSVAGDRGRARNFVYGSAKGGTRSLLGRICNRAYAGTKLRFVRVKPGFVDTPMTADIAKGGPLWATPDRVAADIERAVDRGRAVVYTPWFWWPIMMIIRHLPRFVFHRLKI